MKKGVIRLIVAAACGVLAIFNPAPTQASPSIILLKTSGAAGLANIATGLGFTAGEVVVLTYNAVPLGSAPAALNGGQVQVFIPFNTPTNNPTGIYNVSLTGQTSGIASTTFNQNAPLVTLAQGSGLPGSVNTVTGNGFAAGETVGAAYNGVPVGSSVMADSRGTAVVTFDIPGSNPAGNYNVSLTGHTSSLSASAFFVQIPTIVLASLTGPPGLTNLATSHGFFAGETVSFFYNNETVGATSADANGKVVSAFVTPSNNPDGFYIVSMAGQTSLLTNTAAFNQNAALVTLAYAFGNAGTANTATGFGFAANEWVDVLYDGVPVAEFQADATGKVIAYFTVPTDPVGIYPVQLAGESSGVTGTANFIEAAYLAELAGGSGAPGSLNVASGSGFFHAYPNILETVNLYYNGVFVTSVQDDPTGTASAPFVIPTGNPSGTYPVLLRGASSGVEALGLFNQNATLVTLASSFGAPNSPNTATGYGYASGESVALSYDGVTLALGVADSSGTVSMPFTTPTTSPTGSRSVSLKGQTSGLIGSAAFFQFVPVVITSQPENAMAVPGQPVSVSVTASSSMPLTYQWVKDGMLLPGQTSSTLSFASFQLTNSGTYQVVVSNTAGIGISVPALLSVTNSPLRAWGDDYYHELGDGNSIYNSVFLPELVATNVVAEAAGGEHSLFVTADGNLWAMGNNTYGQLGDGGFAEQNLPEKVWNNVVAVAAGYSHSLFVTADGNLWAMGDNTYGELGDGSFNQTNRPVLVDSHVVAVAASGGYSLYVKADGTLWTMGYSDFGIGTLGISGIRSTNLPVIVAGNVVAMAAGGAHALYVTADGTLWAMGIDADGQLGDGQDNGTYHPEAVATNVVAVAAGANHSLYVTEDGKLWGMGDNRDGELGNSNPVFYSTNRPMVITNNVVAITAGGNYSLFVTADGKLWGMGDNTAGELGIGDGSPTRVSSPTLVNGGDMMTASLAKGSTGVHALALAGAVPLVAGLSDLVVHAGQPFDFTPSFSGGDYPVTYQWELNSTAINGATDSSYSGDSAGTGDAGVYTLVITGPFETTSASATLTVLVPAAIAQQPLNTLVVRGQPATLNVTASGTPPFTYEWIKDGVLLPGQMGSSVNFTSFQLTNSGAYQVIVSNLLGVAISEPALLCLSNAPLRVWGNDDSGQLGDGNNGPGYVTVPELLTSNVVAEAAANQHSLFVTADGNLWATGDNSYGELGDGTYNSQAQPEMVWTNVVAVAAGAEHSLYITADGNLWAMGDNTYGELGDGTFNDQLLPEMIWTNVVAVAAGNGHSLFVTADGTLRVMGNNSAGELGDGTDNNQPQPEVVWTNVAAVAAGAYHSLYVTADGNLWVMGDNSAGELGDGTGNPSTNRPEMIWTNVVAVAAGAYHSLYVTADANLWAMGDNTYGELGDGTGNLSTNLPEMIMNPVVAVAAGGEHSLFIMADGSLWAMGDDSDGQQGNGSSPGNPTPALVNGGGLVTTSLARGATAYHVLAVAGMAPELYSVPDQVALAGQPFNFGAVIYGGDGPFTYQWQFDSAAINGATSANYGGSSAGTGDAGTYTVVVNGTYGSASASGMLTVNSAPPVITALTLQSNPSGPGLVLTFTVGPNQTYTVQVSTDLISWSTLGIFTSNSSGQLVVTDPGAVTATRYYRTVQ